MSIYKQGKELYHIYHMQKPVLSIYREGKEVYKYSGLTA